MTRENSARPSLGKARRYATTLVLLGLGATAWTSVAHANGPMKRWRNFTGSADTMEVQCDTGWNSGYTCRRSTGLCTADTSDDCKQSCKYNILTNEIDQVKCESSNTAGGW